MFNICSWILSSFTDDTFVFVLETISLCIDSPIRVCLHCCQINIFRDIVNWWDVCIRPRKNDLFCCLFLFQRLYSILESIELGSSRLLWIADSLWFFGKLTIYFSMSILGSASICGLKWYWSDSQCSLLKMTDWPDLYEYERSNALFILKFAMVWSFMDNKWWYRLYFWRAVSCQTAMYQCQRWRYYNFQSLFLLWLLLLLLSSFSFLVTRASHSRYPLLYNK